MRRFKWLLLIIVMTSPLNVGINPVNTPNLDPASELLASMTPRERVGQLFIVTLDSADIQPSDPILELINRYYISGVLLDGRKVIFTADQDTPSALKELTEALQQSRYESVLAGNGDETVRLDDDSPTYIPLFIASEEPGSLGGLPVKLEGIMPNSSPMSIGATWDPSLALAAGEALGESLESLGINMLLGPSLDVLEEPQIMGGNIGVQSFGGDPYWVGLMGEEYIRGLHTGSQGGLAVVAKHFPGLGSSDRPINEEVATVRKTIDQITQTDLAPFLTVTNALPGSDPTITDGLFVGHIRYQGFHGNIRATTRPISLDPQALSSLMELQPLMDWREGGGVTMSDSLGSNAIRRFKDPTEQAFDAHLVARDAFLAGNDLLLLSDFRDNDDPDEYTTIVNTLLFFENKYEEDELFAQLVDDAALRVLNLKLRIYGDSFFYPDVINHKNRFDNQNSETGIANTVAQTAATLLSPALDEIDDRVGGAPELGERIVFFSDVRISSPCPTCDETTAIPLTALEDSVIRLYGPGAAGQVGGWNLRSFSMADLSNYLGEPPTTVPIVPLVSADEIEEAIRLSDWLIFNVLDNRSSIYGANALNLLLDQRPDLAQSKKLVVFAYDTPDILDATDISKIDVYYALYDNSAPFIEVASKLLFRELSASGASPIDVAGIGYDLVEVTSPDPDQIIQLILGSESDAGTQEPSTGYSVGDILSVDTSVIVDNNGNHVPDNTIVDFVVTQQSEGVSAFTLNAYTQAGIASAEIALEHTGLLSITAQSGGAQVSEILQFNVDEDIPAQATLISPTVSPTQTVEPASESQEPSPSPEPVEGGSSAGGRSSDLGVVGLIFGALGLAVVGGSSYASAYRQGIPAELRTRYIQVPIIGGLLGYNYLALGLPGSATITSLVGPFAGFIVATVAGGVVLLFLLTWNRVNRAK